MMVNKFELLFSVKDRQGVSEGCAALLHIMTFSVCDLNNHIEGSVSQLYLFNSHNNVEML